MKAGRVPRVLVLAILLALAPIAGACSSPTLENQVYPTSTQACRIQPLPTGEKFVGPTLESTPEATARPGQKLSIRFSGGYVTLNNSITCGEKVVDYVYSDELPTPEISRSVVVTLDDLELAKTECPSKECTVDFMIPENTLPGKYELTLLTPWNLKTSFDIEILK